MLYEMSLESSQSRLEMTDSMAESKQSQQTLLINDGSEDFETLLPKNIDCTFEKTSTYDLQKLPQTASHLNNSSELPLQMLSMDFKNIVISPSCSGEDGDLPLSGQSDDDSYLPATLRSAISITNKPLTPKSKRKRKQLRTKKTQTMQRSKSDKHISLRPSDLPKEGSLTKSLHIHTIVPTVDDATLLIEEFAETTSKPEEITRPDNRGMAKKRRKSETSLQRPGSSHRENRRTRKNNPDKDSSTPAPFKLTNMRRSKPRRSRSQPKSAPSLSKAPVTTEENKQNFEWGNIYCFERDETSQEQQKSEPQPEPQKEKEKSKKSNGSSDGKIKRSKSRTDRILSRSLDATGVNKDDIDWKRPSPRQEQKKRSKQQKQRSPKSSPKPTPKSMPKSTEQQKQKSPKPTPKSMRSTDARPKKSKTRTTKMVSSKATTSSCRNLLLKINQINDDRLSGQSQVDKTKFLDESRSTVSTTQSTSHSQLDEVTFHTSNISCQKLEKSPSTPKAKKSGKSRRKPQEEKKPVEEKDGKPSKPKRTKSAPLSEKFRKKVQEKKKTVEDQVQEVEKPLEDKDGKPSKPKRTKSATLGEKFRRKIQEEKKRVKDQVQTEKKLAEEQEEKQKKPPRTKSDPLLRKGKDNKDKISRSKSGGALSNASSNPRKARSKKKPLSIRLMDFGLSLDLKRTGRNKNADEKRHPPRRSKSDSSLRKQVGKNLSGYDLMASMRNEVSGEFSKEFSKKKVVPNDYDSFSEDCEDSDTDEAVDSIRDLKKLCERSNRGLMGTVPPPSPNYEDSMTSEIMAGFMNFGTRYRPNHAERRRSNGKVRRISGNSRSGAVVVEDSDDMLSMVEYSEQFEVSGVLTKTNEPKAPVSCLQIDFSQLSPEGKSGDIVVRSKKIGKKIAKIEQKIAANNKSNQQLRSPLSLPQAA